MPFLHLKRLASYNASPSKRWALLVFTWNINLCPLVEFHNATSIRSELGCLFPLEQPQQFTLRGGVTELIISIFHNTCLRAKSIRCRKPSLVNVIIEMVFTLLHMQLQNHIESPFIMHDPKPFHSYLTEIGCGIQVQPLLLARPITSY